jgi:hypothetical protein
MKRKRIARDDKRDGGPRLFDVPSSRWTDMTAERTNSRRRGIRCGRRRGCAPRARAIAFLLSERGAPPTDERRLSAAGRCVHVRTGGTAPRDHGAHAPGGSFGRTTIIDIVLPEVARQAGRRWMDDEISFADVTIVTARLQETVRALGRVPRGGHETRNTAGRREGAGAGPVDHSTPRRTYASARSWWPTRSGVTAARWTSPWTCILARSRKRCGKRAITWSESPRRGAGRLHQQENWWRSSRLPSRA